MTGPQPPSAVQGMWLPIDGPQATPHTMGLLASARRPATTDGHWVAGFAWRPEYCVELQAFNRCDDLNELPPEDPSDVVYYQPTAVRVDRACQIRQVREMDMAIVSRQLAAATEYAVAHELWTGEQTQADPYVTPTSDQTVNFALADSSATILNGSTAMKPAQALGQIEKAAMAASSGQPVTLHVDFSVAELSPYNFRVVGNSVFTERGNLVIASGGYDGSGPDGSPATVSESWMYATGPVEIRLSDIDVITDPVQTIDRSTNTRTIWAQRYIAATFDPCIHFAAKVDTTTLG